MCENVCENFAVLELHAQLKIKAISLHLLRFDPNNELKAKDDLLSNEIYFEKSLQMKICGIMKILRD